MKCLENKPLVKGEIFGRWEIIEKSGNAKNGAPLYTCKCTCEKGTIRVITKYQLVHGKSKSCGCLRRIQAADRSKTHGLSKHPLYSKFCSMIERCERKRNKHYKDYGEKGISVCDEWRNDFKAFYDWSMNNGYSPGLTIDRIDYTKDYNPNNCRYTTFKEQANNTSRNRYVEYNGVVKTMSQWSDETGISYGALKYRLNNPKWTIEMALTTPVQTKHDIKVQI